MPSSPVGATGAATDDPLLQAAIAGVSAAFASLGRVGPDQWKDEVLFPSLAADASEHERARFERAAAVAKFFGGTPRTGTSASDLADLPALPKVAPRVAPSGAGPVAPRKKKEGC